MLFVVIKLIQGGSFGTPPPEISQMVTHEHPPLDVEGQKSQKILRILKCIKLINMIIKILILKMNYINCIKRSRALPFSLTQKLHCLTRF